jgi:phage tail sheath protein FI
MAIPTSPSVVVLENDISVYAPNVDSSVVGLVGFANKGPINKATLITSQENLIKYFGRPDTTLPGQGLEGALEILEATNQLYFVRGINSAKAAAYASANVGVGASPAVYVSGYTPSLTPSSIYYAVKNNAGNLTTTGTVDLVSSTDNTTKAQIFEAAFNPAAIGSQNVFAYVDGTDVYLASKYAGSGATLQVSAASGLEFGFSSLNVSGDAKVSGGGANITVSGFTASNVDLVVKTIYPGAGYNLSLTNAGETRGVSIEVDNVSTRDRIVVNSDGAQVESFNNLEFSPTSTDSLENILNSDVINNQSEYVFADLEKGAEPYVAPNQFGASAASAGFVGNGESASGGTPRFLKVIEGTYSLTGGESGASSANDLIGSAANKSGMYALDDDTLNISLGLIPGITDDAVQNAFISLAETSKNFFAIVAAPQGIGEVQDAIKWANGQDGETRSAALNSSYAATYWPWVQVFNPFASAEQWYDPSIFAARQCVFTDSVAEPWFAPAGFRRGRLTKPTNTEVRLNQGDRDALYSNSINPIANDSTMGITIFGQRTTQRAPTALDRVNVRRLMIYIRKVLLELGKPFQFEPNDEISWSQVEETINPFLSDLLARRAIIEGVVKCDSSMNTPARVDRNELWCSVQIKPTKAAETIVFEVNLTSQSATFN